MSATHRTKEERLNASDQCYTQPALARVAVRQLVADGWLRDIRRIKFLEPSCGELAWVDALLEVGVPPENIQANDIVRLPKYDDPKYEDIWFSERDFLKLVTPEFIPDCIIGNPPFNDLGSHIETALNLVSPMGIVVFLMPSIWFTANGDEGSRRHWVQTDGRPKHRRQITPRPKFRQVGTDSASYEIVIWAPGAKCGTTFDMLDWWDERELDNQRAKEAKRAQRLLVTAP